MSTSYTDVYQITELQRKIMKYVTYWASVEKTPVPQRSVIDEMIRRGSKEDAIAKSLAVLVKNRYIRRAVVSSNKTFYVQIKSI